MITQSILHFFQRHSLPTQACTPYLVAVSGGRDSMVLAHAMHTLQIPMVIAHCNFKLREAESDADTLFVQNWANERTITCFTTYFDTAQYATEQGISIQMAARALRYQYFDQLRQEQHLNYLITAHHASDSVETALYQFNRGSGLAGMSGIPEVNGSILRPLLSCAAAQIHTYAQQHAIAWREDSSNSSDYYARNFIRHHIVPKFEELNPQFLDTAIQTIEHLKVVQSNYTWFLNHWLQSHIKHEQNGHSFLPIKPLLSVPQPQEILRHWLLPKSFQKDQIGQLADQLQHVGWTISAQTCTLTVDREFLILSNLVEAVEERLVHADDIMVRLGGGFTLFRTAAANTSELKVSADTLIVPEHLLVWPLRVRAWQEGDAFQPFGMQGKSQKIQDLLVNLKLSRPEKSLVRLLVNGDGTPIWVMGIRSDHRFKIDATAEKIVQFTLVN